MPIPVGTVVAGYRIERVLGAGGMGTVYLARHPSLLRYDALKVLSSELSHDREFRARFLREAELAATLDHPNIVTVYDRGETYDGQLWIAMQYVEGTDAGAPTSDATMPPPRAVHIVAEVAKALDYAHSRRLLHRDVKPANFLLTGPVGGQERVLLADFGIARALDDATNLTATGGLIATVAYAAPESVEGRRVDHRADIYSLGCALFRLLTGRTPYAQFKGMSAMMMAHVMQPIPRATEFAPSLPRGIDDVFMRALAKDPDERFQSAGALAGAAIDALHGQAWASAPSWQLEPTLPARTLPPMHEPPAGWAMPPRKPRRWRRPVLVGAAIAAAVATAAGVAITATRGSDRRVAVSTPTTSTGAPAAAPVLSDHDRSPVTLVTVDATCAPWRTASKSWANSPLNKWQPDDPASPTHTPASAWNPEQRLAMKSVDNSLRDMALATVPLVKATPHRAMREVYEQFIAYSRAYRDSLSNYFPEVDIRLGEAFEDAYNVLISTCNVVVDGDAVRRAGLVKAGATPTKVAAPQDPANPQRFIGRSDKVTCAQFTSLLKAFDDNQVLNNWKKFDDKLPANQWTPEQRTLSAPLGQLVSTFADDAERTTANTDNPVINDFVSLSAAYFRAFVGSLSSYDGYGDLQLRRVGSFASYLVENACSAVGA